MEKEIIWTVTSLNQMEKIYFHLLEKTKSFNIAKNVLDSITTSVNILKTSSEIYETDEMRLPQNENYKAFEVFSYRISYKITKKNIYIIRVRHTSRNIKFYK